MIDAVKVAPLAFITAPEKRCGKMQFLDVIKQRSTLALVASNTSSSADFRVIEAYGPTLCTDEADVFTQENEEPRGANNSSHTRISEILTTLKRNGFQRSVILKFCGCLCFQSEPSHCKTSAGGVTSAKWRSS